MDIRDRLFRDLYAAVISSRLRPEEIRHAADLLAHDPGFSDRLARALREFVFQLSPQGKSQWAEPESEALFGSPNPLADHAYSLVKRRRLSKDYLISLFKKIAPEIRWSVVLRDQSTRSMVSTFIDRCTTSQVQKFLETLGIELEQDPYLGGISSRE